METIKKIFVKKSERKELFVHVNKMQQRHRRKSKLQDTRYKLPDGR